MKDKEGIRNNPRKVFTATVAKYSSKNLHIFIEYKHKRKSNLLWLQEDGFGRAKRKGCDLTLEKKEPYDVGENTIYSGLVPTFGGVFILAEGDHGRRDFDSYEEFLDEITNRLKRGII